MEKSENIGYGLTTSLEDNINILEDILRDDDWIAYRRFVDKSNTQYCLVFAEDMVNEDIINQHIIEPIMGISASIKNNKHLFLNKLENNVITASSVSNITVDDTTIEKMYQGQALLLINGYSNGLLITAEGWDGRPVTTNETEKVVRGPKEGFTESVLVNISLIRRRLPSSHFKAKRMKVGKYTKSRISICYLENVVSPDVLKEVIKRIHEIEIDGIIDSGYIEEFIDDEPYSPLRTIGSTEKPDVAVSKLLEGRVIILVDGSPIALSVPYLFMEYFQASEDYYLNYFLGTISRLLRVLAFFLSTSTPAIYVALVAFHQEMIPTKLLFSIISSREGVPLPTIVEALAMIVTFDIIREAGTRIPDPVGQTVSIVGALVLGQAAVEAKFVSAPIVIVIALTGICSFIIANMNSALILIRLLYVLLAAVLGLYGYIFGVIAVFLHIVSLRSFGVPYMMELGSVEFQESKDTIIRAPWWLMKSRPKYISSGNKNREGANKNKS